LALGKYLRQLRIERELSQRNVAEMSGVSVSYLSDIERGRTDPSLHVLKQIAAGLGISIGTLLEYDAQGITGEEWILLRAYRANDWPGCLRSIASAIVGDNHGT
jgi:transcriptional regulator with XRE-family HTH domain